MTEEGTNRIDGNASEQTSNTSQCQENEENNKKCPNLVFHIVNAIKGGCGKSTVSLMLANKIARIGDNVAIIDLDLNGSSWVKDYKSCLTLRDDRYIQNYMYDYRLIGKNGWNKLTVRFLKPGDATMTNIQVPVILSNTDEAFVVSECEVDLFEQAISMIIKKLINESHVADKPLHIIFDMPPSYECHADRIVNHLMLDSNSLFYKGYIDKRKDKCMINHYLVCGYAASHVYLNVEYFNLLHRNRTYSNYIRKLEKTGQYKFYFVINEALRPVTLDPDREPDFNSYISKMISSDFKDCFSIVTFPGFTHHEYYFLKEIKGDTSVGDTSAGGLLLGESETLAMETLSKGISLFGETSSDKEVSEAGIKG